MFWMSRGRECPTLWNALPLRWSSSTPLPPPCPPAIHPHPPRWVGVPRRRGGVGEGGELPWRRGVSGRTAGPGCIDLEGYGADLLEEAGYVLTADESAYITRNNLEFLP